MALKHAEPDEVASLRRPGPMLATSKTALFLATGSGRAAVDRNLVETAARRQWPQQRSLKG